MKKLRSVLYVLFFLSTLFLFVQAKNEPIKPVVNVHYLGHSSVVLQFDNGITVLTDYGQSYSYGLPSPIYGLGGLKPDIVLYSHDHIDHTNGKIPDNIPHILTKMNRLKIKGLDIRPIPSHERSLEKSDNTSYVIQYQGKKILHLGDVQALIIHIEKDEVKQMVKSLYPDHYDLVLLPIGYMNDIAEPAIKFISFIKTDRIVPVHYWSRRGKRRFLDLIKRKNQNLKKPFKIRKSLSAQLTMEAPKKDFDFVEVISLEPAPFTSGKIKTDESRIKEIYDLYTRAVANRDLQKLLITISKNSLFHFLTSRGALMNTREEYIKWHSEWFKQPDWKISFESPLIQVDKNSGYTISVFFYNGKSSGGKTVFLESFFTLIWKKENGEWKIISDICTPVKREIK